MTTYLLYRQLYPSELSLWAVGASSVVLLRVSGEKKKECRGKNSQWRHQPRQGRQCRQRRLHDVLVALR